MMKVEIIIFSLSIPAGFLVAWLAGDELVQGRRWFRIVIIVSIIGMLFGWITGFGYISWTFAFAFVVALISVIKSNDKKWAGIRQQSLKKSSKIIT